MGAEFAPSKGILIVLRHAVNVLDVCLNCNDFYLIVGCLLFTINSLNDQGHIETMDLGAWVPVELVTFVLGRPPSRLYGD